MKLKKKKKFVHFIKAVFPTSPARSALGGQVGGGGGPRRAAHVEGSWGDALVAVVVESTPAVLAWWSVEVVLVAIFFSFLRRKVLSRRRL
jgi:hypothetical protein